MPSSPPSLEAAIVHRLTALTHTLAAAESCTGGLIAHRITNVPGSSACFLGGVAAYANAAKTALLGVPARLIESAGAVSAETAASMAEGVATAFAADWGIGVTGIAGPGGGTPEKPVGLVFIGIHGPGGTRVARHRFSGDRAAIKNAAAEAALTQLWERIT